MDTKRAGEARGFARAWLALALALGCASGAGLLIHAASARKQVRSAPRDYQYRRALDAALIEASRADDTKGVQALLRLGAEPNISQLDRLSEPFVGRGGASGWSVYFRGTTALAAAVVDASPRTARLLLEDGADVNARDDRSFSPLMWAAIRGRRDMIALLLDWGARINDAATDEASGWTDTPLMFAAQNGYADCVRLLLARGADPNVRCGRRRGDTALMMAASDGHVQCMELLLAHGADVNALNRERGTALMQAAGSGEDRAVEWLLDHGALLEARDENGWTALMHAAVTDRGDCTHTVRLLIARGADLNARGPMGMTVLELVTSWGSVSSGSVGAAAVPVLKAAGARR